MNSIFGLFSEQPPNDANPRLMFAGEATHPNFWSFMHGARESGIREAQRILNLNVQNK